jgi:hypothetical protein
MTDAEFEDLLARSLEGTASEEETRRLWEAALASESRRARLLEERDVHHELRRLLAPGASPSEFLQGFLAELSGARKDPAAFARDVAARAARKPRLPARRPGGRAAAWIAAAAVVTVALGLFAAFASKAPERPRTEAARTPPVAPPPAEPRRQPSVEPPKETPRPQPVPEPRVPDPPRAPEKPAPPPPAPEPEPEPQPAPPAPPKPPPPPAPPERPAGETRVAIAHVERFRGEAHLLSENRRTPVKKDQPLYAGQGLQTAPPDSFAVLRFPDGTRWQLGPDGELRDFSAGRPAAPGKPAAGPNAVLSRGVLTAHVARQDADHPMIFLTPHAEARVLGTTLRLVVDPGDSGSTRLEVEEGKVRLTRADGKAAEVPAGHFAVAATGVDPRARPLPRNLLLDPGFERGGRPWHLLRPDGNPLSGRALVPSAGRGGSVALQIAAERAFDHQSFQDVAPTAKGTYVAAAWLKTEGLGRAAGRVELLWLNAPGVSDAPPPSAIVRTDVLGRMDGTEDWLFHWGRFEAPAAARAVRFRILTEPGTGTLGVDDCQLLRLDGK